MAVFVQKLCIFIKVQYYSRKIIKKSEIGLLKNMTHKTSFLANTV